VDIWSATSLDNIVGLPISENDTAASLAWASDSRRLAVTLENSSTVDITEIQILDVQSQQQVGSLTLPKDAKSGSVLMGWAPVGDYIALSKGANLYLMDPADASKNISVKNISNAQRFENANALAWSPDGKFLALAATSGFWVYSLQARRLFSYNSDSYVGLTWLPNGRIALVSDTGQVQTMSVLQTTPTAS
jgi:WD40 repeat protein